MPICIQRHAHLHTRSGRGLLTRAYDKGCTYYGSDAGAYLSLRRCHISLCQPKPMRLKDMHMAGACLLSLLQVTEPEPPNRLLLCECCTVLKALVKQVWNPR